MHWFPLFLLAESVTSSKKTLFIPFQAASDIGIQILLTVLPLKSDGLSCTHLAQQDLGEVKGHEADAHSNRPFDPVHAQAFVQATDDALL